MVELFANCGVWSGSALFANYPFRGLQTTMGYGSLIRALDYPPFL